MSTQDVCLELTKKFKICTGEKVELRRGPVPYIGVIEDIDPHTKTLVLRNGDELYMVMLDRRTTITKKSGGGVK
jgi:hypothetical protein